jgi:transposase-like protein
MESAQPARYVLMSVTCTHPGCNRKQNVHVAESSGGSQMGEQEVRCLKCDKLFLVRVPARIVAGPFPMEA